MSDYPLETIRHSAAHVMAAAVKQLYPDAKFDIGPATENGFYYDFDMEHRLVAEDLKAIEKAMKKLIGRGIAFERFETSRDEAKKLLAGQPYKLERLADIPEGEPISFYRTGDFLDLCRGPHVEKSSEIGAVKLTSVAGSYFRGDEKNPMLQRIYGTAFPSEAELQAYLKQLEEAAKRDHRKLGVELDLFGFSDQVGPGLVLWHPKGALIRHLIETYWKDEHYRNGYELLYTPHIGQSTLWETSGHINFYRDGMYSPMQIDEKDYFVKPMNCPFHIEVYQSRLRSYRELPMYLQGGVFGEAEEPDFNFAQGITFAKTFFSLWPQEVDMVFSPMEAGQGVEYTPEQVIADVSWTDAHPIKQIDTFHLAAHQFHARER